MAVSVLAVVVTSHPTVAAPVSAADREGEGLILTVEGWAVSPRSNEIEYAFLDVGGLAGGGELARLEGQRQNVARFYLGWQLKSSPGTQLGATFWSYDGSSAASAPFDPNNIGPRLASPTFQAPPFLLGRVDVASAESDLQATVVDGGARWSREFAHGGQLRFDGEIRFFRFEREVAVHYSKTTNVVKEVFINTRVESSGVGPRAGVSYDQRFGDRFAVSAQIGFALPTGKSDSEARQEAIEDGGFVSATAAQDLDGTRAFLQMGAEIGFEVRLWQRLTLTFGYGFDYWAGVERTQEFTDVAQQAAAVTVERDVVFEGAMLGLRYAF